MTRSRIYRLFAGLWLTVAAMTGCATATGGQAQVAATYPHDPSAFTEGLFVADGMLFESTGRYAHSSLRRVDLTTGKIQRCRQLADRYFGEGIALAHGRLYQLTWKSHVGFVYAPRTLKRLGRFHYTGQGWGLTFDGHALIMSDGSSTLRFIDPDGFHTVRRLRVTRAGKPVDNLNELEYIDGEIWANVWFSDRILRIDPETGRVIGTLNAANLRRLLPRGAKAGVLNGIAFDPVTRRVFVTGKNWPLLFAIAKPTHPARRR